MKRREFLKTSLTATTLAGLSTVSLNVSAAESVRANREYYELRSYRLKAGSKTELLDSYLEKAAIPAIRRHRLEDHQLFCSADALFTNLKAPAADHSAMRA